MIKTKIIKLCWATFLSILFSLFLISIIHPQAPDERGYIVKIGAPCPDFKLEFSDGSYTSVNELQGKVIMLQFTASWCSVCRNEMPHIEKEVWGVYKNLGLMVIGIDRDEPVQTVRKFAKETQISYPLALDPGANIFGLFANKESGVPRNIIINPKGEIVFLTRLFDPEEFKKMIQVIHSELENLVTQEQIHLEQEKLSLEGQLTELDNSIQGSDNDKGLQNAIHKQRKNLSEKIRDIKVEEEKLRQREEKLKEIKSN